MMDEDKAVTKRDDLQRNNTVPLLFGDAKDDKIQILMEGYLRIVYFYLLHFIFLYIFFIATIFLN